MWVARKPGKIIGGAWETRGVSAGGATAKVLILRPNTTVACLTTRGTAWPPACVPNTGGPNLRGRRRGTPILGKQATHCAAALSSSQCMELQHRCVPVWPPLCATLFTKICFKQTKMPKLNEAKKCGVQIMI